MIRSILHRWLLPILSVLALLAPGSSSAFVQGRYTPVTPPTLIAPIVPIAADWPESPVLSLAFYGEFGSNESCRNDPVSFDDPMGLELTSKEVAGIYVGVVKRGWDSSQSVRHPVETMMQDSKEMTLQVVRIAVTAPETLPAEIRDRAIEMLKRGTPGVNLWYSVKRATSSVSDISCSPEEESWRDAIAAGEQVYDVGEAAVTTAAAFRGGIRTAKCKVDSLRAAAKPRPTPPPLPAAKNSTALVRVGDYLTTVEDVVANPKLLTGKGPAEIAAMLGKTQGWKVETLGQGSKAGKGWVLREYTAKGDPTGRMMRWHPGGGHHGPDPYWRVTGGAYGKSDIIPGGSAP